MEPNGTWHSVQLVSTVSIGSFEKYDPSVELVKDFQVAAQFHPPYRQWSYKPQVE
jgi:hypothetical protein